MPAEFQIIARKGVRPLQENQAQNGWLESPATNKMSAAYAAQSKEKNVQHEKEKRQGNEKSTPEIVLGLEDADGERAEIEIDTVEGDSAAEVAVLLPRVRRSSIADKLSKSKASEAKVASIKENAEQRQKDFEQLLDEHAELVQEISRSTSTDSISQRVRD